MMTALPYVVNIGIGVIILALVKYIFMREKDLLMGKEEHYKICNETRKDVNTTIKEEFADFKAHFDTEMENKLLKSLRNINGTLEQKIADVVAQQVALLSKELTTELNKRLDLVEILKLVVKNKE